MANLYSYPVTGPITELLDIYREALDSFERRCLAERRDPVPRDDDELAEETP